MVSGSGGNIERVGVEAVVLGVGAYMRDVGRVVDGQNKIQRETEETARVTKRSAAEIERAWNTVGTRMVVIGGAITAAFGLTIKAAIDFEQQFANVRKTVDLSEADFQRLERGIFDLARVLPVATSEINEVVSIAGQLGVEGVENLLRFANVAIGMGISTDLSAADAAFRLAQLLEVTKSAPEEIEPMASAIVELGNNTATTESRIADFALRLAPTAERIGFATDELLGLSATVLSLGINTERGATAIDLSLTRIEKAVAAGDEALTLIARTAGLTEQAFTRLFRRAPLEAFLAFVRGLGDAGSDASLILDELTIGGVRAAGTLGAIAQNADFLAENIETANRGFEENVALQEEVARFSSTTSAQLKIFANRITEAAIEVGRALLPALELTLDVLNLLLDAWNELPDLVQAGIVIFSAAAGALTLLGGVAILAAGQILQLQVAMQTLNITMTGSAAGRALGAAGFVGKAGLLGALATFGFMLGSIVREINPFGIFGGGAPPEAIEAITRFNAGGEVTSNIDDARTATADFTSAIGDNIRVNREWNDLTQEQQVEIAALGATTEGYFETMNKVLRQTGFQITLTEEQTRAWQALVDQGVDAEVAFLAVASTSEDVSVRGQLLVDILGAIGNRFRIGASEAGVLIDQLIAAEDPAAELALILEEIEGNAEGAGDGLDIFGDSADQATRKLANLTSQALAADLAIQFLAATARDAGPEFLNEIDRIETQGVNMIAILVREEERQLAAMERFQEEADRRAGIVRDALGGGGGIQQVLSGFDLAVEEIQRARADQALLTFLAAVEQFGVREPAVLAALLAAEAETSGDITRGLREIVDLFPDLESFLFAERGQFAGEGLDRLFEILGASVQRRIPTFQTGGLVTGDRVGAPILAQLHVGEFVIPADRVAALLNPAIGRGPDGGTVNFTANYFEVESPVRVRDDIERLRMAGRF